MYDLLYKLYDYIRRYDDWKIISDTIFMVDIAILKCCGYYKIAKFLLTIFNVEIAGPHIGTI